MSSLSLVQQQKLQTKLSPAQIQLIRMLELPTVDLQKRINEELQENPVLEEGANPNELEQIQEDSYENEDYDTEDRYQDIEQDLRDYGAADDDYEPIVSHSSQGGGYEDSGSREIPYGGESLIDYLKSQVYLTKMTKPQRHIAKWVLGNIDDDGYLRRTTEQLVDDLAFQESLIVSDEEMAEIVGQIKEFDPPGIASADVRECLLTQLKHKEQTEAVTLATKILTKYYGEFTKRHYERLQQSLGVSEEEFRAAVNEITRLNQSPTNAFTSTALESNTATIIPDFEVLNYDGKLRVSVMTGDIPSLHVSDDYKQMIEQLDSKKDKEAVRFIKNNITSATMFIDAIRKRNETLLKTITALAGFQREFFMEGDESLLKPLVLQDLADATKMDLSTISRACNNKYVQTDFGIYPLKFFFSESLKDSEGTDVSTRAIRQALREVVDSEDKTSPLGDEQIVEALRERGLIVARRTVAKYRDLMGIPVARMRKEV
ncbi:MAG: RNA polymerase factor sigma-54 [Paludibacteraceae bacterium]|nr:RNA polymerase factor sigma-54 [Paludibacteraceae bacterium]